MNQYGIKKKSKRLDLNNNYNSLFYYFAEEKEKEVNTVIIEKKLENIVKRIEEEIKAILSDIKSRIGDLNFFEESHESLLRKIEKDFKKCQNIVKLDIGGKVFKVSKEILMSIDNTYFYGLLANCDKFQTQSDGSFFIDRNPRVFDKILDYFRYGKLEVQELTDVNIDMLKDDFDYYCIPLPKELRYNLQWDSKSNRSCYLVSNNNFTVTKSNRKTGIVIGNVAVDRFTVKINENGFLAIGFYDGSSHDNIPTSNGWFIDLRTGDIAGIGEKLGSHYYFNEDGETAFINGDYVTVIREETWIRFEKNKVNLGYCEGFRKIPNQSLFPAVAFFGGDEGESVTLVKDF